MENKSHALLAGAFVLLLGLAAILTVLFLTSDDGEYDVYELSSSSAVTGLQAQAPVRYKGVPVGRVTSIGFDELIPGNVLVRIEVEESTPLTANTYASLNFQGVTGLSFVQLDDAENPLPILLTGSEDVTRLPMKDSQFAEVVNQLPEIMAEIQELGDRANKLLADENLEHIRSTLANFDTASAQATVTMSKLDNSIENKLNPALANFPALTTDMQSSFNKMADAANSLKSTSKKFGGVADSFQNELTAEDGAFNQLSTQLGKSSDALVSTSDEIAAVLNDEITPQLHSLSEQAIVTMQQVDQSVQQLDQNPQALLFGNPPVAPGPGESGFAD